MEKERLSFEDIKENFSFENAPFALKGFTYIEDNLKQIELTKDNINLIRVLLNNEQIKRFKVARQNNFQKAFQMWINWVNWKIEYKPELIKPEDVMTDYNIGKSFIHGCDKEGKPIIVILVAKHLPDNVKLENTLKLAIYWFEEAIKLSNDKEVCVLVDNKDVGWTNVDYPAVGKNGITAQLQNYYPERLGKILVVNVSLVVRMILKVVFQFLDEKTKSKIVICSKMDDLQKYIDKDNLLKEHGGLSDYKFS